MKSDKLKIFAALLLFVPVFLFSCKEEKKDDGDNINPESVSLVTHTEEEQLAGDIIDNTEEDMESIIGFVIIGGERVEAIPPCNATITTNGPVNDTMIYTITYNGLSCDQQWYREGVIELRKAVNESFAGQGTAIRIKYLEYYVTHVITEKSMVFNGTKTLTNVSGGLVRSLGSADYSSVKRSAVGRLQVRTGNEEYRTWNIARDRTYTGKQGELVLTVKGIGESDNYTNLTSWGVNRAGDEFYTSITTPVVYRQVCNWKPCEGMKQHELPGAGKSATITFGFDGNNDPISANECPERFKIDWQKGDMSGTRFVLLR